MTGVEAVADGVQAFKSPESKNAAATLFYLTLILGFLFVGISLLAGAYRAVPSEIVPSLEPIHEPAETVVSQIARGVFGRGWFYYVIQIMTAAILILAANTAYQDFPRLSSILARDRLAPRQLANIGDRLVFTNGILALSALAAGLIIIFKGDTHALIPLYALGVFVSFTLSQFSMSLRQRRLRQARWKFYSSVSLFGSVVTAAVVVIVLVMRFATGPVVSIMGLHIRTGAWMVMLLIPIVVVMFLKINRHYLDVGDQLRVTGEREPRPVRSTSIVLVAGLHQGILEALDYARSLSHDCRGLYIEIDPHETGLVRDRWEKLAQGVPLVILESPYRSVIGPTLRYLEEAKKERPDYIVTVVLPEFVPKKLWHKLLHNQTAILLKVALMTRKDMVVTNVRYYLEK